MPSVFDQPTRWPASRAMCAIIREVVVLPLVPVTATTGTFGRIVVGPGPRSVVTTCRAASSTSVATSVRPRPSMTEATASPSARARLRSRQG